jgi:glycosyltransferase involved in cell wall biosynthesis
MKNSALYAWVYRRKEWVKRLVRYQIPLEIYAWNIGKKQRSALTKLRRKYDSLYCIFNDPLVSVTIATYNRGKLLCEKTLPSVLGQTYQNFEIIIVGDCCTDDTEERIAKLADSRIRFYNLSQRGPYPKDRKLMWFVAGVPPINRALEDVRGDWIAHLDDDDLWQPHHLETSLEIAYDKQVEFVAGPGLLENSSGGWRVWRGRLGGSLIHSSFVYRSYLNIFKYDERSWQFSAGADMLLVKCMLYAGVRCYLRHAPTVLQPLRPGNTTHGYTAEDRFNLL